MPLVHSEKIDDTNTLLLWRLTETEHELHELLGSTHNYQDLEAISHPQKKLEWLASRLLVRILTEQYGVQYQGTYKDDHGKMYLLGHDVHISITHTASFIAAVLNPTRTIGIDMEKVDDKLRRTAHKYLNEQEFDNAADNLNSLAIFWCAKEAMYKQYGRTGISFKNDIFVDRFSPDVDLLSGYLLDEQVRIDMQLHVRWIDDHCLVVAV